jgi:hypothetical protein
MRRVSYLQRFSVHFFWRNRNSGAPVQGLKLCPNELCPTIGRALRGLGLAARRPRPLLTVYRLCRQQW